MSLPRHGTNARYMRGCRCERCHTAYKAYHREWQRRGAAKPRPNALYQRIAPDAARLYRGGLSLNEVAVELGVSLGTVDKALKHANMEKRPQGNPDNLRFVVNHHRGPGPVLMLSIADRAAELYATGMSMAKVAGQLGVGSTTVHRALGYLGIERREAGPAFVGRVWAEQQAAER